MVLLVFIYCKYECIWKSPQRARVSSNHNSWADCAFGSSSGICSPPPDGVRYWYIWCVRALICSGWNQSCVRSQPVTACQFAPTIRNKRIYERGRWWALDIIAWQMQINIRILISARLTSTVCLFMLCWERYEVCYTIYVYIISVRAVELVNWFAWCVVWMGAFALVKRDRKYSSAY